MNARIEQLAATITDCRTLEDMLLLEVGKWLPVGGPDWRRAVDSLEMVTDQRRAAETLLVDMVLLECGELEALR